MAKEWILNSATNRFQLNFKRNVGAVSEAIRRCEPTSIEEWERYYFSQVRSREEIEALGRRLYVKVTEVIAAEVESVTESDCIDYLFDLVIRRTYEGYTREIDTVYGKLQQLVGRPIEPAPDQWDRGYNVDFFIRVGAACIGLQINPVTDVSHVPQIYKEQGQQAATHAKFEKKVGGRVFYVFSATEGRNKAIQNPEVIEMIRAEIRRLEASPGPR